MNVPKDHEEIYSIISKCPSLFEGHSHRLKGYFDHKAVVIIANPRSGSTLLMRLLIHACMTRCVGDRLPSVYEGLVKLRSGFFSKHYQYRGALMDESFPDMYCGYSDEAHQKKAFWNIVSDILFSKMSGGHCKMTMLGWNNDLVVPFVEMLRATYEEALTIIWLTRDSEEVAQSLCNREGGKLYGRQDLIEQSIEMCDEQTFQFQHAMDLEDYRLTYDKLTKDPIGCLKKCSPYYTPDKEVVDRVMANKLR